MHIKIPISPIGADPKCLCRILFLPGEDGKPYVPSDKVATSTRGGFTHLVCKYVSNHVIKKFSTEPGDTLHHDTLVIAVGGVCLVDQDGSLRAEGAVYFGEGNS